MQDVCLTQDGEAHDVTLHITLASKVIELNKCHCDFATITKTHFN